MKPDEITAALGLKPSHTACVGERRKTPKGDLLNGNHPDTSWRYSERHTVKDQWFVSPLAKFVDSLIPYKDFLHNIIATHGRAEVIVQFLGDDYFGDNIEPSTLAKLADLKVEFGLEVFMVPQTP